MVSIIKIIGLTADVSAGLVVLKELRIHANHHALLFRHHSVAFFDLVHHPVPELLAQDGGANVDDELLGDLGQVDVLRQVVLDLRLVGDELHDVLDGQALVLWHVQGLDLVVLHVLLLPADDILEEVDGDVFCSKDMLEVNGSAGRGLSGYDARQWPRYLPYGGRYTFPSTARNW